MCLWNPAKSLILGGFCEGRGVGHWVSQWPISLRVCLCVCVRELAIEVKLFRYIFISTEVNPFTIMVLQAAIHSVPQHSPTLMKTKWPAFPRTNVAAMMTKEPITPSEKRFHRTTATLGMSRTEYSLSNKTVFVGTDIDTTYGHIWEILNLLSDYILTFSIRHIDRPIANTCARGHYQEQPDVDPSVRSFHVWVLFRVLCIPSTVPRD